MSSDLKQAKCSEGKIATFNFGISLGKLQKANNNFTCQNG